MNIIEQHMKVVWVDHKEIRDALEETFVTSVPSIIVQDQEGHKVNYQGMNFKVYWHAFVSSNKNDSVETHLLNKLHTDSLFCLEKIKQSLNDMTHVLHVENERKNLLNDETRNVALQQRLAYKTTMYNEKSMENAPVYGQAKMMTVQLPMVQSTSGLDQLVERERQTFLLQKK